MTGDLSFYGKQQAHYQTLNILVKERQANPSIFAKWLMALALKKGWTVKAGC